MSDDFEDSDDKARRNLVLASSAILISAWLNIPFSAFVAKLVYPTYTAPDSFKVWAVGCSIMAYLGIRYRFSSEGKRFREALETERDHMRLSKILDLVTAEGDAFTKTGREPAIFGGKLEEIVNNAVMSPQVGPARSSIVRPKLFLDLRDVTKDPWMFTVGGEYRTLIDGRMTQEGSLQTIPVSIQGNHKRWIQAKVWVHSTFYSESSSQLLIPVVLAFAAQASLLWKIFQNLFG